MALATARFLYLGVLLTACVHFTACHGTHMLCTSDGMSTLDPRANERILMYQILEFAGLVDMLLGSPASFSDLTWHCAHLTGQHQLQMTFHFILNVDRGQIVNCVLGQKTE
jgi:hypothetical protein